MTGPCVVARTRDQLLAEQSRVARLLRYSLDEAEELEHHGLDATQQALLEQMRRLEYLLTQQALLESLPRMADYARVLAALDAVTEPSGDRQALARYVGQADALADAVIDGDPFVAAVVALVRRAGTWSGNASALLADVEAPDRRPRGWPTSAQAVGSRLKRYAPALRTAGIDYPEPERTNAARVHTLTWTEPVGKGPSRSSRTSRTPTDQHQRGDNPPENVVTGPAQVVTSRAESDKYDGPGDNPKRTSSPDQTALDLRKHPAGDMGDDGDDQFPIFSVRGARNHPAGTGSSGCRCPNGCHGIHRDDCPASAA